MPKSTFLPNQGKPSGEIQSDVTYPVLMLLMGDSVAGAPFNVQFFTLPLAPTGSKPHNTSEDGIFEGAPFRSCSY